MTNKIEIKSHIKHTNNTLIFGEINGSVDQNIPSLKSALRGEANFDKIIEEIDAGDTNRLLVHDSSDVTNIFKPTYYFWNTKESDEGKIKLAPHHDTKYRENATPVQISKESLCFRLLSSEGNINIDDLTEEIRGNLKNGLDSYIKTIGKNNEKIKEQHKKIRDDLVSKLSEPVVIYLLLAKSSQNYNLVDGNERLNATNTNVKTIGLIIPNLSGEGNWEVKLKEYDIPNDTHIDDIDDKNESSKFISERELNDDIRQGKKYIAEAAQYYLESIPVDGGPSSNEQKLIQALVHSSVAERIKLDHLTENQYPRSHNLLESEKTRYISENKDLQRTNPKLIQQQKNNETSTNLQQIDKPESKKYSQNLSDQLVEEALQSDNLNDHINVIQRYTNEYYGNETDKHQKIATFLHTLTSIGKIEYKFVKINKRAGGKKDLNGVEGFELYLELCLEEAAKKSPLIRELKNVLTNTLLLKPHPIDSDKEEEWKRYSDDILELASKVFDSYMAKVVPVASQILGIDVFLKTSNSANRKPRVIIANTNLSDILDNTEDRDKFEKLLKALNTRTRNEFEQAISIVIAPPESDKDGDRLPLDKEVLFELGHRHSFCAFVSPDEPIECGGLDEDGKLQQIVDEWSSKDNECFSSGVLCLPDNVLIPGPFIFKIGNYLTSSKSCQCEFDKPFVPVVLPACYAAAGLVARNDDAAYVKSHTKDVKIKSEWPCIGIGFDSKKPLWQSESLSDGVIHDDVLIGNPPLCLFEHRKDGAGKLVKQRIKHLNTLYIMTDDQSDDRPVPVHEVRIGQYLQKALYRNCPDGASAADLVTFGKNLAGISDKQYSNSLIDKQKYELEFNKDTELFDLKFKKQDRIIYKFSFSPAASAGEGSE